MNMFLVRLFAFEYVWGWLDILTTYIFEASKVRKAAQQLNDDAQLFAQHEYYMSRLLEPDKKCKCYDQYMSSQKKSSLVGSDARYVTFTDFLALRNQWYDHLKFEPNVYVM